jgi:hypothetical protein
MRRDSGHCAATRTLHGLGDAEATRSRDRVDHEVVNPDVDVSSDSGCNEPVHPVTRGKIGEARFKSSFELELIDGGQADFDQSGKRP